MNPTDFPAMKHPTSNRRALWAAAAIALATGGLSWSIADASKPKVSVKVDQQPITREAAGYGASYAPVVKQVAPAVVQVQVTQRSRNAPQADLPPFFNDPMWRRFFGEQFGEQGRGRSQPNFRRPPQEGMGSGVIVSADGYVLTNNHVVTGADVIKVTLNDRREFTAKVVGTDPQSDLAVIKIDAENLPAVTFADSSKLEVGDQVLAIGNPFGLGQTVTSGIVSALGRATLGLDYQDFIQTDAAINPGNSGGALVDVKGRLVGINTAILSRSGGFQGIGFAIPSDLARSVMEQLVEGGKVVRGYLGVSIQDLSPELAEAFKLKANEGAIIAEVVPGSPAAKGGLKSGDVITELNGSKILDSRRLRLSVADVRPGREVTLKVLRDDKPVEIKITVGQQPRSGLAGAGDGSGPSLGRDEGTLVGVGVADLDPQMRREFNVPAKIQGVLVTEVEADSKSAEAGLQPGDVIQEINQQPVRTAEDAIRLTENPESKKTLLRVWSQRGIRFIVVDETETE